MKWGKTPEWVKSSGYGYGYYGYGYGDGDGYGSLKEEVSIKGVRRWKEDGRARQETKVFMQTINPFNKNVMGQVKSRDEILGELIAERSAWLAGKA